MAEFNYDPEAAMAKIPQAIESVDEYCTATLPKAVELMNEVAAQVNAPKLTACVATLCDNLENLKKMFMDLRGEEGDSTTEGTVYGALKCAKTLEATMGG